MATHSFYKLYNIGLSQARNCKFVNFAILSVFGRRRDTPPALWRCVEWACQIMSWLKIGKYDRENTTIIDMLIHGVLLRSASRRRRRKMQASTCRHAGRRRSYAGCMHPWCGPDLTVKTRQKNYRLAKLCTPTLNTFGTPLCVLLSQNYDKK